MSEIVIYEDGVVSIEATVEKDTLWLSQQQIADLFDVQRPAITKHLNNIFKSDELSEKVVCSILEHTTPHGAMPSRTQKERMMEHELEVMRVHECPGFGDICEIRRFGTAKRFD